MKVKTTTPRTSLLEGANYTPSATTDITETWRKAGWVPLNELRKQASRAVSRAKERRHAGA
jgi:hypothetical protein